MRSVLLTCSILLGLGGLVVLGLLPVSVRVHSVAPAAQAKPLPVRGGAAAPTPAQPKAGEADKPVTVQGAPKLSPADAELDALVQAQLYVENYLRSLNPPVSWKPPLEYIRNNLAKGAVTIEDVELSAEHQHILQQEGDVASLKRAKLEITITSTARREMLYLARQERSENRMLALLPVLGGLVLVLLAASAYIHLDERTKGYYTTWLRVVAGGAVVALLVSGWWFFTH